MTRKSFGPLSFPSERDSKGRWSYPALHWFLCELVWELAPHLLLEGEGEQSPMHPQAPFVVNESRLPKAVHEEAHSRARRTDHLRQSLLSQAVGKSEASFTPGLPQVCSEP